jgi:hypothetical protein
MSRNNPRSDRKPRPPRKPEGEGAGAPQEASAPPAPPVAAPVQPTVLQHHGQSETMRLIRRAVANRWAIPEQIFTAAPAIVGRILLAPETDIRDKIRAVQTLAMLDRNNTDLMLESHRIERLNDGMSTENVALVASISDEQIAAVGRSILPPEKTADEKPRRRR